MLYCVLYADQTDLYAMLDCVQTELSGGNNMQSEQPSEHLNMKANKNEFSK